MNFSDVPHRRYNPLVDEWVLVSSHRSKRPWHGKVEKEPNAEMPVYDPSCYLCPGNERKNGMQNPEYDSTFVFENDFPALFTSNCVTEFQPDHSLIRAKHVQGICRVICFSPRHDLTLAEMPVDGIRKVVERWVEQDQELRKQFRWVQIFENKGSMMGCSSPHPHGQIWASDFLPTELEKEDRCQQKYFSSKKCPLLLDYLDWEMEQSCRVVVQNEHWVGLVPYWAKWPFETLLIPRRHISTISALRNGEKGDLAKLLKRLLVKYDNLFQTSFPYSMGWHGAPEISRDYSHWHLHAHFYPPLFRSAKVKKFMVGYEMLAEAQRDITPEKAAERLRNLSEIHYKLDDSSSE